MGTKTALRLTVSVLLTASFAGTSTHAARPAPIPAEITFANASGDLILSDSFGPTYRNGEMGVSCVLQENGNLVFHSKDNHPNAVPQRWLNFLFDPQARLDDDTTWDLAACPISTGSGWSSGLKPASLTVVSLLQMEVGATVSTMAIFTLGDGQGRVMYGWPGYCSTPVQVTRQSATTWTVAAGAAQIAVLEQLVGRRERQPTSYWTMPFTLTVIQLP